jgi:hypothetical protein
MSTEPATTPATGKTALTEYVVLTRVGDEWKESGIVKAASATGAIRAHLDRTAVHPAVVAVPARSWQPVTVTVETKTVLKLDNA